MIDLRPKSVQKYNYNIKLLKQSFEAMNINYLDEFTPDHSSLLYSELLKEKIAEVGSHKGKTFRAKPKTINFFLNTVRGFFQLEILKGHLDRNPFLHIKNLRVEKKRPTYYSKEELKLFFAQEMPDTDRNAFMGLLFSGMRISELINLTWKDVDFNKRLLYVRPKENYKTKSFNSERSIPVNDVLYELMKKLFHTSLSEKYPFCSPRGKKLSDRRLLERCKQVAEKAGLKSNAFLHKFRSTHATWLVMSGVPIHSVKGFLAIGR
ncbi:MAG TPA: site-specific integrase [Ignavibacteriaceae bacterium]|nr:site-specific integrase [Ignavibacteriaceae bacterium]